MSIHTNYDNSIKGMPKMMNDPVFAAACKVKNQVIFLGKYFNNCICLRERFTMNLENEQMSLFSV